MRFTPSLVRPAIHYSEPPLALPAVPRRFCSQAVVSPIAHRIESFVALDCLSMPTTAAHHNEDAPSMRGFPPPLRLSEDLLDGVQIRRIGGQERPVSDANFDRLTPATLGLARLSATTRSPELSAEARNWSTQTRQPWPLIAPSKMAGHDPIIVFYQLLEHAIGPERSYRPGILLEAR
jgi:hypothetical protein